MVSGETQAAYLSTTTANTQVKAGRLKALAVLSDKRFPAAPEIPAITEAGIPGIEANVWFGLLAPAKTPRAIINRINEAVVAILKTQEAKDALLAQGAEAVPTTPEGFARFLNAEIVKWERVIKAAGIAAN